VIVVSGGTASGTTLSGGGFDLVFGTAVDTMILSGGIEGVQTGGVSLGAQIDSGGIQVVDVGGLASGTIAMSGGAEVVVSGGTASGTTISSGGFMDVRSGGAVGSGAVTFSGGGTLQLDDSVHFGGGLLAGFGVPDMLDLRDITFSSGTTVNFVEAPSNSSGTLMVGNGTPATTANITLLGQYMTGQFNIKTDGAGGTLVTDPPVSAATDGSATALVDTHH
jgi:autotransporter passenger strand-loop-strand repeat protein